MPRASSSPKSPASAAPSHSRIALLAGATGLVGHALLQRMTADDGYAQIHLLTRRAPDDRDAAPKRVWHTVDFEHLPPLPTVDDVLIALGTTIKVAGSQEAFRRVDLDHVVAVARAAHERGARRLAVVSALGADPASPVFYNRIKGEMQTAITRLGYETVVIAQPSFLIGDRSPLGQRERPAEVWINRLLGPVMPWVPGRVRPIAADAVATALLAALHEGAPGVRYLSSARMQAPADRPTR